MRLFVSAAVLFLALAAPALAQTPSQAPSATTAAQPTPGATPAVGDKKKDSGIVCRQETPTGSHFPVKVCTTLEQRKAEHEATRRAQGTMQGVGAGVVPQ